MLLNRVLYRDGLMLVLDKPAGLPVHPGPGGGSSLEAGFDALRFGLPRPPALAHRLDRDTSGCLVLGRHPKALRRLGLLFAGRQVEKTYWAIVSGRPATDEGMIEARLSKQSRGTGWRMVVDPAGQEAATSWRLLATGSGRSWLELRPHTGRTHQIRIHCATLGCPLIGDPVYAAAPAPTERATAMPLLLHARAIVLPLYPAKPAVAVNAPVPAHMLAALAALGYDPAAETGEPVE